MFGLFSAISWLFGVCTARKTPYSHFPPVPRVPAARRRAGTRMHLPCADAFARWGCGQRRGEELGDFGATPVKMVAAHADAAPDVLVNITVHSSHRSACDQRVSARSEQKISGHFSMISMSLRLTPEQKPAVLVRLASCHPQTTYLHSSKHARPCVHICEHVQHA